MILKNLKKLFLPKKNNVVSNKLSIEIKLLNNKITELEKLIYHLVEKVNVLTETINSSQKIMSQNILLNEEIAYNFDQTIKTLSREITEIEENFDTFSKESNKDKKSNLN